MPQRRAVSDCRGPQFPDLTRTRDRTGLPARPARRPASRAQQAGGLPAASARASICAGGSSCLDRTPSSQAPSLSRPFRLPSPGVGGWRGRAPLSASCRSHPPSVYRRQARRRRKHRPRPWTVTGHRRTRIKSPFRRRRCDCVQPFPCATPQDHRRAWRGAGEGYSRRRESRPTAPARPPRRFTAPLRTSRRSERA